MTSELGSGALLAPEWVMDVISAKRLKKIEVKMPQKIMNWKNLMEILDEGENNTERKEMEHVVRQI